MARHHGLERRASPLFVEIFKLDLGEHTVILQTRGEALEKIQNRLVTGLGQRDERGRSSHLVSNDLREWTPLCNLHRSFPAFAVSGVAVRDDELLLAGRVFVDKTPFGWGLLRSDGRNFEARPVPLPLAPPRTIGQG